MKPSNAHPTDSIEGTRRDGVLQANSASVRRPDAGRRGRDSLDYQHRHPSLGDFARLLGLRYHQPRTRHAYYRRMRLIADQVSKRIGAPIFMVTFALPEALRGHCLAAGPMYRLLFAAAASALADILANPRCLPSPAVKPTGRRFRSHTQRGSPPRSSTRCAVSRPAASSVTPPPMRPDDAAGSVPRSAASRWCCTPGTSGWAFIRICMRSSPVPVSGPTAGSSGSTGHCPGQAYTLMYDLNF
jgi:hypothetical protein